MENKKSNVRKNNKKKMPKLTLENLQNIKENHALGLSSDKEVVKLTNEEIDDDYENLDLSQFDKT